MLLAFWFLAVTEAVWVYLQVLCPVLLVFVSILCQNQAGFVTMDLQYNLRADMFSPALPFIPRNCSEYLRVFLFLYGLNFFSGSLKNVIGILMGFLWNWRSTSVIYSPSRVLVMPMYHTESISHILLCSSIDFFQYFNCIVILPSTLGLFLDFCCFKLLWMDRSPLIPVPKRMWVHTCVHGVCMCMNMCVQLWKPEFDAKCPPHHSPSYLVGTWPFIVTWSSLFQLDCWLVRPWDLSVSTPSAMRLQVHSDIQLFCGC